MENPVASAILIAEGLRARLGEAKRTNDIHKIRTLLAEIKDGIDLLVSRAKAVASAD